MRSAVIVFCCALGVIAGRASAQDAEPTAQQRQAAADAFDRGTAAFLGHDWASAAQWFETANRMAPAQAALLWAVKAHARAGDTLRAATLALRLRETYGADDHATARTIGPILEAADRADVRVDVTCEGCSLDLDGTLQESKSFYLEPGGDHAVVAHFETGDVTQTVNGAAGDHRALAFTAPPPPPATQERRGWPTSARRTPNGTEPATPNAARVDGLGSAHANGTPPNDQPRERGQSGMSPIVFGIGAGLTAVAGGILIWSAVDMYGGVDAYKAMPTMAAYDAGHATEIRTMVLEGVTGALAAATIVVALFTDWGGGHATTETGPQVNALLVPLPGGAAATAAGTF